MLKVVQDSLYKQSNSFNIAQRIPTSEGFSVCLKSKSIANQYYKLFYMPNHANYARLGIIASKKIMNKAVERNFNKRVIREVFRKHPIKSIKFDIVVLIKNKIAVTLPNQKIELNELLSKLEAKCVLS